MSKSTIPLPTYEEMVKAGMHLGRKKSIFDPRMKPYTYLLREGVCIIDLVKTCQGLIEAANFLKKAIEEKKIILFVGLSKQSSDLIRDWAVSLDMPYVTERWLGGTLTNFKTISSRVQYLELLEKEVAGGEFNKYTKKERLMKEKELSKLRSKFGGLTKLTRLPDIIFVASVKDSSLAIKEAKAAKIKVGGVINTESNPTVLDYVIPANDNARGSLELIIRTLKDFIKAS